MTGFGNSVENAVLDLVLRGTAYPYPFGAGMLTSLHTADPGDTGANEVVGGSYVRVAGAWAPASGGTSVLAANVDFVSMPAVIVTHFGVWTAAGVFVGGGPTTTQTVTAGSTYRLTTATSFALD